MTFFPFSTRNTRERLFMDNTYLNPKFFYESILCQLMFNCCAGERQIKSISEILKVLPDGEIYSPTFNES